MFESVAIPLWAVVLFGVLALVGLLDRIIGPGMRWFVRRKANAAIDELNTRLHLGIQSFKTTKRQVLIDRLLMDKAVLAAVEEEIKTSGQPRDVVMARAATYAKEIVPAFNAYAYSKIGTRLARWASTFVYRVRLGYTNEDALSGIDRNATVVFVMNHRSNMDYVLVTYLASASATLSYAVGEWARVWLLQNIIRAMGAYFIRRDSGNLLYRRVLARYVSMATRSGVTQAVFPEGGLSRDGRLGKAKLGLFGYMMSDFDPDDDVDVVFVPVGLNYDRVLEDRVLTGARRDKISAGSFRVGVGGVLSFIFNLLSLRLRGKLYRYGYACAGFGNPVSLKDWISKGHDDLLSDDETTRFEAIQVWADHMMGEVGKVVPVLPVALVATVISRAGDAGLTELQMKANCNRLMESLQQGGAHIHVPRMDHDYAISTGLRMLLLRKLVREENGLFHAVAGEEAVLDYYVNSIAHLNGFDDTASGQSKPRAKKKAAGAKSSRG